MPEPVPQKNVLAVLRKLSKEYPDHRTELTFEGNFQLMVAVILSAQCTDAQVNRATPGLFAEFPTAEKMAKAKLSRVETLVKSCGFYRNKAKNIISASQDLVERFGGEVPADLDDLVSLAGVGRKTASVVMNQAFDLPAIAVDTHVKRVSHRLGWSHHPSPEKIEFELRDLIPKKHWTSINGLLILHGRKVCNARKPKCEICSIRNYCRYFQTLN